MYSAAMVTGHITAGRWLDEMVNTLHPHDPDGCPGDAKANLNFRADRDAVGKRPEA